MAVIGKQIGELDSTILETLDWEIAVESPEGDGYKLTLLQVAQLAVSHLVDGSDESFDTWAEIVAAIESKSKLPSGSMLMWPSFTVPDGFLIVSGGTINRGDYPDLWSFVNANADILAASDGAREGLQYGPGDGSTTFSLPDPEGLTPKVYATGRTIADEEDDAIRNITGATGGFNFASHYNTLGDLSFSGALERVGGGGTNASFSNSGSDDVAFGIDFDASRVVPTASENRVKNFSVNLIVKY